MALTLKKGRPSPPSVPPTYLNIQYVNKANNIKDLIVLTGFISKDESFDLLLDVLESG